MIPADDSADAPAAPTDAAASPDLPGDLPVLPLEHFILFPAMIAPIIVGDEKSKRLVDEALAGQRLVAVLTKRPEGEGLTRFRDLYRTGTAATILKMLKMPDGSLRLLLHGTERITVTADLAEDPYLRAAVAAAPDFPAEGDHVEALAKTIHNLLAKAIELSSLPDDLRVAAANLSDPGKLADLVASNLSLKIPEQQSILETADITARLEKVAAILQREVEVLELGSRIQTQVKTEIDRNQREFILREQMKVIRKELGEEEGNAHELEDVRERIVAKALPKHARDAADKELGRLRNMQPASAEYTVRPHLPRDHPRTPLARIHPRHHQRPQVQAPPRPRPLRPRTRQGPHPRVPLRAQAQARHARPHPLLCRPPGVGKTSLGRSIAQAMGRKFVRISLGGLRDEAEIRGHRRTYIGAMPGRLIKGLRASAANNPVVMLDEIDKLGSDYRGDPASAMLEVLDPEQNSTFTDNYLDMPFDLSNCMFITTANQLDPIPGPLRDRMEVIEVSGYTLKEKLAIAKKYIVPKQMAENGLTSKHVAFTDAALVRIAEGWTREAGLRNLERQVGTVCRKLARAVVEGRTRLARVTPSMLPAMLGPERYFNEVAQRAGAPGVAVGLAWTPVGGEILFLEATMTAGTGRFTLTGQLGDVMKESAQAAFTYLHSEAGRMGIPEELFSKRDIHVHVPAGAIPKDGPSAGITMCAAIASLMTGRAVKDFLAMTGEITLKGNVLPVGGIREKILAAARAGIREVIVSERNKPDIAQLPEEVRRKMKVHTVSCADEMLDLALEKKRHRLATPLTRAADDPAPSPKPQAPRKPAPKRPAPVKPTAARGRAK